MATTSPAPTKPAPSSSKHVDREASLRNIAQTEQAASKTTPAAPSTPAAPKSTPKSSKPKASGKAAPKASGKQPSKADVARQQREANAAKAAKAKPTDDDRLRDVLKRAQMSVNSELSDDARKRALDAPASLSGGALRARIQGKSTNGKSSGETRERFAQHGDIATGATAMLRVNAPKRGACSTRAVEFTLKHVGRKDVGKTFLPGVAKVPATLKALATGKSSVRDLPEPSQKAIKDAVAKIAAASTIVRYDARTFAAILVARDA